MLPKPQQIYKQGCSRRQLRPRKPHISLVANTLQPATAHKKHSKLSHDTRESKHFCSFLFFFISAWVQATSITIKLGGQAWGRSRLGTKTWTSLVAADCNATARHRAALRLLERTDFGGARGNGTMGRGKFTGKRGTTAQQTRRLRRRMGPGGHGARQIHRAREARRRSKLLARCT
jgi:hypothetical protein